MPGMSSTSVRASAISVYERDGRDGAQGVRLPAALEGSETQRSAWTRFLADPEWVGIKKETATKWGDLVDDVQDRSLEMLPYTPKPSMVP